MTLIIVSMGKVLICSSIWNLQNWNHVHRDELSMKTSMQWKLRKKKVVSFLMKLLFWIPKEKMHEQNMSLQTPPKMWSILFVSMTSGFNVYNTVHTANKGRFLKFLDIWDKLHLETFLLLHPLWLGDKNLTLKF